METAGRKGRSWWFRISVLGKLWKKQKLTTWIKMYAKEVLIIFKNIIVSYDKEYIYFINNYNNTTATLQNTRIKVNLKYCTYFFYLHTNWLF